MPRVQLARPLVLASLLVACGKSSESPPAGSAPSATAPAPAQTAAPAQSAAEEARAAFIKLCTACHGASGRGDGAAAANLDPKPRDYTDKAWQASVTDAQIKEIIVRGGQAVGKSQLMPAWPQFQDKPQVLDELVKLVRSFGQ